MAQMYLRESLTKRTREEASLMEIQILVKGLRALVAVAILIKINTMAINHKWWTTIQINKITIRVNPLWTKPLRLSWVMQEKCTAKIQISWIKKGTLAIITRVSGTRQWEILLIWIILPLLAKTTQINTLQSSLKFIKLNKAKDKIQMVISWTTEFLRQALFVAPLAIWIRKTTVITSLSHQLRWVCS